MLLDVVVHILNDPAPADVTLTIDQSCCVEFETPEVPLDSSISDPRGALLIAHATPRQSGERARERLMLDSRR
jgi:hypothetical protein